MSVDLNPLNENLLQVLDDDGEVIDPGLVPAIPGELLVEAYKLMLYVRTADLKAFSYQRQGRLSLYAPNLGQEAAAVGVGMTIRPEDWLVPAYRELGAWLQKGATLKDIFLYWMGVEEGCRYSGTPGIMPISVPIASQIPHAVGIAFGLRYLKKDGIVFVFFGDGATSQGDFHEGMNFAGVWKAPVVFVCQNNQYAISLPRTEQTASASIARKAAAYGMAGVQVDGNDLLAVYGAAEAAAGHARSGMGPVLIEAVTYRRGAHTTSDDPYRYRTREEEEAWEQKDPIKRLRNYLARAGLWDPAEDGPTIETYEAQVDDLFEQAESHPPHQLEDVFQYHFQDMPGIFRSQMSRYQNYLAWKGGQR